jgi:hypothetical protein
VEHENKDASLSSTAPSSKSFLSGSSPARSVPASIFSVKSSQSYQAIVPGHLPPTASTLQPFPANFLPAKPYQAILPASAKSSQAKFQANPVSAKVPEKRGRGRPRKREPLRESTRPIPSVKRGRGRPRKTPLDAILIDVKNTKPRGRPRKIAFNAALLEVKNIAWKQASEKAKQVSDTMIQVPEKVKLVSEKATPHVAKKPRGRPPGRRNKQTVKREAIRPNDPKDTIKRPRGRPRKYPVIGVTSVNESCHSATTEKMSQKVEQTNLPKPYTNLHMYVEEAGLLAAE